MHSVVVATRDLGLGHTLASRDVRTESLYASEIPRDAITDARAAEGRVVVVPVLRDAIVFTHHLAAANRSGLDGVVPVGDRAVHVAPKDGFRPAPGTIVDVLAAFDPTAVTVVGSRNAAVVVASGALVLTTDRAPTDAGSASDTSGVTLLVTDSEARVIAFAAANADITRQQDEINARIARGRELQDLKGQVALLELETRDFDRLAPPNQDLGPFLTQLYEQLGSAGMRDISVRNLPPIDKPIKMAFSMLSSRNTRATSSTKSSRQ